MRGLLKGLLTYHWLLTLFLMGLFALGFGLASLNLFTILSANLSLIIEHGVMALVEGALLQLIELIALGYLGVVLYVLFKVCERVLVDMAVK